MLPGESLAKYAVADMREDEAAEPDEALAAEVEELIEEAVADAAAAPAGAEPAVEDGGIEAVAEVVPEPVAQPVSDAAVHGEPPAALQIPVTAEAVAIQEAAASEPLAAAEPEATFPADHPFAGLGIVPSVVEIPETAAPEGAHAGPETAIPALEDFDEAQDAEESDSAEAASGDPDIESEGDVDLEAQPIDHEGPEPARIPTSLTAALREQGHRYPHRVSRRMRRKMRGGPGQERGEKQTAPAAEQPVAETRPVETRAETRPEARNEPRSQKPIPRARARAPFPATMSSLAAVFYIFFFILFIFFFFFFFCFAALLFTCLTRTMPCASHLSKQRTWPVCVAITAAVDRWFTAGDGGRQMQRVQ